MDLEDIVWEVAKNNVAQVTDKRRTLVNMVMSLWFP
jgi:hypothetical protein